MELRVNRTSGLWAEWGGGDGGRFRFGFPPVIPEAVAKEEGEDGSEGEGFGDVGLDLHVIVQHAGDGGDVGEAMKGAPAFAAETLDHGVGGGDGERNHHEEGGDADEQIFALAHFGKRAGDAELAVVAEE